MRTAFSDAVEIATAPRREADRAAYYLSHVLYHIQREVEVPLVEGEDGPAHVGKALAQLVRGRPKKQRGTGEELEAWMLAGVVAAGVAAAHEVNEGEPISPVDEYELREALTDFRLRPIHQADTKLRRASDLDSSFSAFQH